MKHFLLLRRLGLALIRPLFSAFFGFPLPLLFVLYGLKTVLELFGFVNRLRLFLRSFCDFGSLGLLSNMRGEPWKTELPLEMPEVVPPAAPIEDLSQATLALVTCGGLVPRGNPNRLPGGPSEVWFKYSVDGMDTMRGEDWESVHVGFFTGIVNENPNYVVPLNILRPFESRGAIKSIFPWYLSTSGRGTPVATSKRIGAEMASYLKTEGVDACLLVAT